MFAHIQRQCAAASKCSRLTFQSCHFLAVGTSQHSLYLEWSCNWLLIIASDGHLDVQVRIAVILIQIGSHIPVEQTGLGCGIEINIIEDASQAPVVLSFQIKAVAVFDDLHRQRVATFPQIACDVILGRFLSAFIVAHLLTVNPQERCRCHLLKTQKNLLPVPVGGNRESGAVSSCRVVVTWCLWRISLERCGYIAEQRVTVAPHLPV